MENHIELLSRHLGGWPRFLAHSVQIAEEFGAPCETELLSCTGCLSWSQERRMRGPVWMTDGYQDAWLWRPKAKCHHSNLHSWFALRFFFWKKNRHFVLLLAGRESVLKSMECEEENSSQMFSIFWRACLEGASKVTSSAYPNAQQKVPPMWHPTPASFRLVSSMSR